LHDGGLRPRVTMEAPREPSYFVPPVPASCAAPPRGRVLCFAPHPDDEVIGPGGALARHRMQGDPVRVVIATDGVAGDPEGRFDKAHYASRRRQESARGLAVLQVADVAFWGFLDSAVITEAGLEQ